MKLIKKESSFDHLFFSSKDGSKFITFSLQNPFSLNCYLFDLSFLIDKAIPGFEFSFVFVFFNIFYRSNKPEAMEYFDKMDEEMKNENLESYSLEEVLEELNLDENDDEL